MLFREEKEFDLLVDSLEQEEFSSENEDYFNVLFPTEQTWEDCISGENCLPWEVL